MHCWLHRLQQEGQVEPDLKIRENCTKPTTQHYEPEAIPEGGEALTCGSGNADYVHHGQLVA